MGVTQVRFMCLFCVIFSAVGSTKTLSSPRVTNWGDWGDWDRCLDGTYATAFQLRVEKPQGGGPEEDDTALNATKLFCNKPGEFGRNQFITSKMSDFGDWGDIYDCDSGLVIGFQLRSEQQTANRQEEQTANADDTAANNLRVFCAGTNQRAQSSGIDGQGMLWGSETEKQICSEGQAVCAIKTQVESPLGKQGKSTLYKWSCGFNEVNGQMKLILERDLTLTPILPTKGDDTALNNVDMECCDIPSPASSCVPTDKFHLLRVCDNRDEFEYVNCKYSRQKGVTSISQFGNETNIYEIIMSLGFQVSNEIEILSTKFRSDLNNSARTGHSWTVESPSTFKELIVEQEGTFTVAPGGVTHLYQVLGVCGYYTVYSTTFKMVEYSPLDGYLTPLEYGLTLN